ncbi:unnamed protein product [Nezara viridula]|uniref:Uncharacterized protein n=1 Tax=Nezara viridula TaxID=85310 RepID=A0A9P0H945_NEZVI|nr:unnamed protein product [Nezara viridula]
MESIGVRKSRRRLEDGSPCPHVQLVFRLSSLLGVASGLNIVFLYHFIVLTSYTLMCSQIIAIGCHILSRYDLVVHTLAQLKNTQHNINNKVETLLVVNHQLSRVLIIDYTVTKLISSRHYVLKLFGNALLHHLSYASPQCALSTLCTEVPKALRLRGPN